MQDNPPHPTPSIHVKAASDELFLQGEGHTVFTTSSVNEQLHVRSSRVQWDTSTLVFRFLCLCDGAFSLQGVTAVILLSGCLASLWSMSGCCCPRVQVWVVSCRVELPLPEVMRNDNRNRITDQHSVLQTSEH